MKIAAVSDIHGNLEGLDFTGDDLVLIAGDFAPLKGFGKWHYNDQKKWIVKKFIPFMEKFNAEFVIVPGNHDMIMDPEKRNIYAEMKFGEIDWPENAHVLQNQMVEINGIRIYGTPNIPIISHTWAFESDHQKLRDVFSNIPEDLDILITHTPPRIPDECLDRSMQWGGDTAFGSGELTEELLTKKPRYVFCGHIHSGDHECVEYEGIKIYNVSRVDERYEIAYEPRRLEIEHV